MNVIEARRAMNASAADTLQHRVWGGCMILAPILLLLSSVVGWSVGDRPGGILQVYAMFLFIPASLGLTHLLWEQTPRLSVALRILLTFGCLGGIGFGLATAIKGAMEDANVGEAALNELNDIVDTGLPLILNFPGIMFPLSMALTGMTLWRTHAVPPLSGILLGLAGVVFPIGRIGDIQPLFYVADLLFVVALGWIGLRFLESTASVGGEQQVATEAKV